MRPIKFFILLCVLVCPVASSQELRVKVFPGAQALPLIAGATQGIFARRGLKVELLFTQSSVELRDDLAKGAIQIAHSAVDNAVAMVERAGKDVVIVSGGDSSMNEFFVQAEVRSLADLKGKVVAVDAPDTAYALQAKKILLMSGLRESADYWMRPVGGTLFRYKAMRENRELAATMLNPPFSVDAPSSGLKSLGRVVDLIGPYQATGAFVLREWARTNAAVLERYLAGLIEATRWTVAKENRAAAAKLLIERFQLEPRVAERTWELLADPRFGLAPDARFDAEGFRNVLRLRAEVEGEWSGAPPPSERYVDLSYYEGALKTVSPRAP